MSLGAFAVGAVAAVAFTREGMLNDVFGDGKRKEVLRKKIEEIEKFYEGLDMKNHRLDFENVRTVMYGGRSGEAEVSDLVEVPVLGDSGRPVTYLRFDLQEWVSSEDIENALAETVAVMEDHGIANDSLSIDGGSRGLRLVTVDGEVSERYDMGPAPEYFDKQRKEIKEYLSTWPKWDDFEFDFTNATFGYEETRELAGVKIPLYKSTLLMVPFLYKPKDATEVETVAYVVFDMAEWETAEDTWRAGMAEEAGGGEVPAQPETPTGTPEKATGGSGEFRVIGVDGTIGESAELVMDITIDNLGLGSDVGMLGVWPYSIRKILGISSDTQLTNDVRLKDGFSMKYFQEDDIISVVNSSDSEEYTIEPDALGLKIDVYHIDQTTFDESKTTYSLSQVLEKFKRE